ncbi:DEAD/DEAH box helicase [Leptospira ilyithenensis]|uniref:RNA helicase n=1 Tax=Leptospira ilyithenensis TaxID=2484901 RepID=A0A4R9LVK2_9LEPT|nr:DEAD/DEAH box helicase [Leptospira ilyithenensis]TGN14620.1 DEAD/DEAH box helicase [Leptospira ilyithenensis]
MTTNQTEPGNDFQSFGFRPELLSGIEEAGFQTPSPIQRQAMPLVLEGKDLIAQAQTGTGKTAAYGLPCLNRIDVKSGMQVLVLTPTRELALQVSDELYRLGKNVGIKTTTIYGGASYSKQISQVTKGAQVAVATPGRLLDLLKGKELKNFKPNMVILDEADEMLDMGFLEDIESIFGFLPAERQTLLFSATMPDAIKKLAGRYLNQPAHVKIAATEKSSKNIEQVYYIIDEQERDNAVVRILDYENTYKAIIFTKTKKEADDLKANLGFKGYPVEALHGDLSQKQRELVLKSLHDGRIRILVATDVAARGLDVKDLSLVINFHLPFDSESYTHRIGRTGRAGKTGKAITLVTTRESRALHRLKGTSGTGLTIAALPTKKEVQAKRSEDFITKLLETEINEEAEALFAKLSESQDSKDVSLKILSQILDRVKISGPEKIGKLPSEWNESAPSGGSGGAKRRGGTGGGSRGGRSNSSGGSSYGGRSSGSGSSRSTPASKSGGDRGGKPQRFRNK